jgi:hypothetical protein
MEHGQPHARVDFNGEEKANLKYKYIACPEPGPKLVYFFFSKRFFYSHSEIFLVNLLTNASEFTVHLIRTVGSGNIFLYISINTLCACGWMLGRTVYWVRARPLSAVHLEHHFEKIKEDFLGIFPF